MPYKNIIYEKIKERDKTSKLFRTTNTVVKNKNNFICYNTDYYGFYKSLQHFEINFNSSCLLLGLGGAGKIVAFYSLKRGCSLTIAVRASSIEKAKKELFMFIPKQLTKKFEVVDIKKIPAKHYNIIVNATPIGMPPLEKDSPIEFKTLFGCKTAIDLIYSPAKTKFLEMASKLKIKTINGLFMLVMQAKKADELFLKTKFKKSSISKLYLSLNNK